jgi:hypothetical protein
MKFHIKTAHEARGASTYRTGDADAWDLDEAVRRAVELLFGRPGTTWVSVGNSEHEFRLWASDLSDVGNFTMGADGTPRWDRWYVDVELSGRCWVYRPLADLQDEDDASPLVIALERLGADESVVGRVWTGTSDGGEGYEYRSDQDWPSTSRRG